LINAGKQEVNDGEPAVWKKRLNLPEVKPSWHKYMIKQVLQDFQASVLQVICRFSPKKLLLKIV